jgi:hypothetical protein
VDDEAAAVARGPTEPTNPSNTTTNKKDKNRSKARTRTKNKTNTIKKQNQSADTVVSAYGVDGTRTLVVFGA